MANSGSGGPPVDTREGGWIIGRTGYGDLKKIFDLPDQERDEKFGAWLRKRRLESEERSRRHLDEFLAEIKFAHLEQPVK